MAEPGSEPREPLPSLSGFPPMSGGEKEYDPYLDWSKGKPRLNCRLHLWHRWRTHQVNDGGLFQECLDCGKYRDVPQPGSVL
jgi:hypothetical protein